MQSQLSLILYQDKINYINTLYLDTLILRYIKAHRMRKYIRGCVKENTEIKTKVISVHKLL